MSPQLQPADSPSTPSRQALDRLYSVAYEELCHLASSIRRNDSSLTLNTTALVNEAWIRLEKSADFQGKSKAEFKQLAAHVMRRLLVEAARRRSAKKRGGPDRWIVIAFDEASGDGVTNDEELLALDAALKELACLEPRQAQVVESRYFGGLEVAEVAASMQVSEATIHRDWRAARAWLSVQIRKG